MIGTFFFEPSPMVNVIYIIISKTLNVFEFLLKSL